MVLRPLVRMVALILFPFLIACGGGKKMDPVNRSPVFSDVSETEWKRLSGRTIYFGHQSVGNNILSGIRDVMKETSLVNLSIREVQTPEKVAGPVLVHSKVGKNEDTTSKIRDFTDYLKGGIGESAEIAFLKFCYLDVDAKTDIEKLFSEYRNYMSALRQMYPKTKFVHVTVPLKIVQENYKSIIKKYTGFGSLWEYEDAKARNRYNHLLRKEFEGKEPIFDVARYESTYPDGRRSGFRLKGEWYETMAPEYTDDGGHLNGTGRKEVAKQLLIFLARQ